MVVVVVVAVVVVGAATALVVARCFARHDCQPRRVNGMFQQCPGRDTCVMGSRAVRYFESGFLKQVQCRVLGGSCVVISGVICPLTWAINISTYPTYK